MALAAAALGAVPLLVIQLTIIAGTFDGLNLRLSQYLVVPVVLTAAAMVPVLAQVLGPGHRGGGNGAQDETASATSAVTPARPMPQ